MMYAYIGRVIFGLGIGTAMHVAPLYIAEISPNDLRGERIINFSILEYYNIMT
jgi:MFS family permease